MLWMICMDQGQKLLNNWQLKALPEAGSHGSEPDDEEEENEEEEKDAGDGIDDRGSRGVGDWLGGKIEDKDNWWRRWQW